jgi:hypothetical protein
LIFSCHNIPPLAELIFNLLNQTGKDNWSKNIKVNCGLAISGISIIFKDSLSNNIHTLDRM